MSSTKRLVLCGLCTALGVVLPMALHSIPNAGNVLLPMHLPVLLAGVMCGPWYGLSCGVLTPLLSSMLTGMPPMAYLPSMLCELAVYGLSSGLMMALLRKWSFWPRVLLSLSAAMLCGRLVYGALNALIFRAGDYSVAVWLTSAFVTGLPGIIIQFALIPLLLFALKRAGILTSH